MITRSVRIPQPRLTKIEKNGFITVQFRTRLDATYNRHVWTIVRDTHIWFIQFFGDLAVQLLTADISQGLDVEGIMPGERITDASYADVEFIASSFKSLAQLRKVAS